MEILLRHFATLASAHTLLVSRGDANISRFIPNSITKPLGKNDNKNDIDTYARQTIKDCPSLKKHFEIKKIDPFKFFDDNANGIFLWVVVLHQLQQTRQSSVFRKHLYGLSDASGSMEKLYFNV